MFGKTLDERKYLFATFALVLISRHFRSPVVEVINSCRYVPGEEKRPAFDPLTSPF
jgi:hypothetical protein